MVIRNTNTAMGKALAAAMGGVTFEEPAKGKSKDNKAVEAAQTNEASISSLEKRIKNKKVLAEELGIGSLIVGIYKEPLLRERFAKNDTTYSFMADVNYDMKISVADLVVLNKFLLGKIDKEEPVTTTTTFEEEDVVTTIRTTTQPLYGIMTTVTTASTDFEEEDVTTVPTMAPLYGPPSYFTTTVNEEEDIVQSTREDIQDVYGPPSWFTTAVPEDEEDTTTTSNEDDIVTETTMTQTVYGPPVSWFTTTAADNE